MKDMRVLIAGGRGFLGQNLHSALLAADHDVSVLTRSRRTGDGEIFWDLAATGEWAAVLNRVEAVINSCGYSLHHWPWTASKKRRFVESRVHPGIVLAEAIRRADTPPSIFVQYSGVGLYGVAEADPADERAQAGSGFLSQLALEAEKATMSVEDLGVRWVAARNAVVLHRDRGLLRLLALPARVFLGGRLGSGNQILPWIHAQDHAAAVLHLLESASARGPYNLVAPEVATNAVFTREVCRLLRRPYWFHLPSPLLRVVLGEMSQTVLRGREVHPTRLEESGFTFAFPQLSGALADLLRGKPH